MRARLLSLVVRPTAPPLCVGLVIAALLIVAETLVLYPLKVVAPVSAISANAQINAGRTRIYDPRARRSKPVESQPEPANHRPTAWEPIRAVNPGPLQLDSATWDTVRDVSRHHMCAPERIRAPNLLIRRHGPMVRSGAIRVLLSCRWRCWEARLSSSSSQLSSPDGAKQRHSHRFLIPADPALTIGCVKGGEAIT
jgi:hypothetical protein